MQHGFPLFCPELSLVFGENEQRNEHGTKAVMLAGRLNYLCAHRNFTATNTVKSLARTAHVKVVRHGHILARRYSPSNATTQIIPQTRQVKTVREHPPRAQRARPAGQEIMSI